MGLIFPMLGSSSLLQCSSTMFTQGRALKLVLEHFIIDTLDTRHDSLGHGGEVGDLSDQVGIQFPFVDVVQLSKNALLAKPVAEV